jgi:hypothetical protein
MKRNYTVEIIDTVAHRYHIEAANSPEEAESIAEQLHHDAYEYFDTASDYEVIDSQTTDVMPDEEEEII